MPLIAATQEADIRIVTVQTSLGKNSRPYLKNEGKKSYGYASSGTAPT
jgi:hypothetical protein